jgi:hypothetical protein
LFVPVLLASKKIFRGAFCAVDAFAFRRFFDAYLHPGLQLFLALEGVLGHRDGRSIHICLAHDEVVLWAKLVLDGLQMVLVSTILHAWFLHTIRDWAFGGVYNFLSTCPFCLI